jgi:hypothetical protein
VSSYLQCVMAGVRYFGVALDYSPSSKYALKWAIDNIFRADDVVILLFVNAESVDGDQSILWGEEGSRKKKRKKKNLLPTFHFCELSFSYSIVVVVVVFLSASSWEILAARIPSLEILPFLAEMGAFRFATSCRI